MFQEQKIFNLMKFTLAAYHYLLSHALLFLNFAKWLDHYYKTKCEVSGEEAPWNVLNGRPSAIIFSHIFGKSS